MKWVLILCLFFLLIPWVYAQDGHIKLLAVKEVNGTFSGETADLYLSLQPGTGRVFLETFPLTKMDTQISTRFAKDIACSYFDFDCHNYDFVYTIKAKTNIVGGPSAGAAMTALTTAVLSGLEIDESVAVTGTINSGGLIGPVGGLKEKIKVASDENLNVVLIPGGTRFQEENNLTLDLESYGRKHGVSVIEVFDLNNLVFQLTGTQLRVENLSLEADAEYVEIMNRVAEQLCNITEEIQSELEDYDLSERETEFLKNQTILAEDALAKGLDYAAASYCFGGNAIGRKILYREQNLTEEEMQEKALELKTEVRKFEVEIEMKSLKTITDLQTFSIVSERLNEAKELLDDLESDDYGSLALAQERLFSAQAWSEFFEMSGKEYMMDENILRDSCLKKIQEAKERKQYLDFFILKDIESTSRKIVSAEEFYQDDDFALCIVTASEAKAEVDAMLSVIGLEMDKLDTLLEHKLKSVDQSLARTTNEGSFPFLAFAYYQYALDLRENDPSSALIYAEYALELGNLDMYFEDEPLLRESLITTRGGKMLFVFGAVFGSALTLLIVLIIKKFGKTPRTTRRQSGGKKR
ncbi:S16 family serine protease [Nanoarchaeota archaeon]